MKRHKKAVHERILDFQRKHVLKNLPKKLI